MLMVNKHIECHYKQENNILEEKKQHLIYVQHKHY